MMISLCPGSQKFSQPQPEEVQCRYCGEKAEIWTDEASGRCQNCGKMVKREGGQTCLDWCRYARECVGDERYNRYREMRSKEGGG
ncbi:MAG: hypothetical protein WC515_08780 [Candidatus Omnitrophota bacterium]